MKVRDWTRFAGDARPLFESAEARREREAARVEKWRAIDASLGKIHADLAAFRAARRREEG